MQSLSRSNLLFPEWSWLALFVDALECQGHGYLYSHMSIKGLRPECVDTTSECVDILSQTGIIGSLGRVTSVDTTSGSVDTLSRTAKQVFWELDLVSTLLEPVSTLPCKPVNWDLWELGLVSTPLEAVSTHLTFSSSFCLRV
ncbi:hypothetical protein Taro_049008 [Colocasia esculenta]|uniref:Uncharacterized protein n=1 Tax=Colocasia esculenta TaxID=4460 RepID=A0A843X9M1_COLES|nr:hypothetical protein [Colocasia esculenta]